MDQKKLQRTIEDTLFTYCDDMAAGEVGMHWSFDWLFAHREAFALSVGRFYEPNESYCHITFKHQSNKESVGFTGGTGLIYELRLPVSTYRFDEYSGEFKINYEGPVEFQLHRLEKHDEPADDPDELYEPQGWAKVSIDKKVWRPGQKWSSQGEMELFDSEGGTKLTHWRWDYTVETIIDRPDYDADLMLKILRADMIPSGNGHFIPGMSIELKSGSFVEYQEKDLDWVNRSIEGGYLDGNFGRSKELDNIVTNRWAWMAAPQLWTQIGAPAEHMFTLGFFQKALIPVIQSPDHWTGAILWRSDDSDMTNFTPLKLFDSVEVRFHSPRYLDMSVITVDKRHRITVRAWSETMTTPLTTPSGRPFQDHQDLLADAYMVIEENTVSGPLKWIKKPNWVQVSRLVTNMFGFEFGEQDRVIGTPGYPCYDAVPQMPSWFVLALKSIPDALAPQTPAPRLSPINNS